ncbi:MAG: hypothetical protein AB7U48_16435 [Bauldia sp.]
MNGERGGQAQTGFLLQASTEALRQAAILMQAPNAGAALRDLAPLTDAARRVSECLEAGPTAGMRSDEDVLDLARARAKIMLNRIVLMHAAAGQGGRARSPSHQKSGNAG